MDADDGVDDAVDVGGGFAVDRQSAFFVGQAARRARERGDAERGQHLRAEGATEDSALPCRLGRPARQLLVSDGHSATKALCSKANCKV